MEQHPAGNFDQNFEGYRDESSEESFNTCSKKDLDRPPPVHLLLRTLLGRPSLASHVRSFALLGQLLWEKKHHLSDDDIALLNSPVPINIPWPLIIFDFAQYLPEERRTLRTEARTHLEGIYGITGFRSKLRLGKVLLSETLFSLLLSAFSNLQTLLIDSDFFKASDLDLFLASPGSNTSLKRLESVEFCRDFGHESDLHWHNPCRTRCVPQLLRLPKIRSLSLPLTPRRIRWLSPSPTLDLQSLMLHHCQLREEHLGELLHRTPTLRSLHYHAWINRTSVVRYGRNRDKYLDCNRLACSLKEVQHCLERLVITVKFFNDLRAEVPEVFTGFRGRLNCLSQFTRLKYVDVPYSMMLGQIAGEDRENLANMLPSSLRSLTISDNVEKDYVSLWLEEEFHSEVEAFLAWFSKQADGQFIPQLSVRWTSDEYMPSERIERLDDIFAELIYLGAEHNVIYSFSEDRCDF